MQRFVASFALVILFSAATSALSAAAPEPKRGGGPLDQFPAIPGFPKGFQAPRDQGPDAQAPGDKGQDSLAPGEVPDLAPQARAKGKAPAKAAAAPKAPETDEKLLATLAKSTDKRAARSIERELQARWGHSTSPSADLLLKRADQAIEADDYETAESIVKKLTDISPDFAEAWHRRAAIGSHKDDYQDAIISLRHVLALQPKNFVALAEIGQFLEEFNDKPHALEAYRQAIALDPFIDGVEDRIKDLTKAVEGQGI